MESSVANFTILPTQNPKRDESMQQEARSDETVISSDNPMIELPHTPASSSAEEIAPARQDDENGAIARRSSELAAIGDTAREFLKEKREKYDELSINSESCVEFYFAQGHWYITSSDGLKLS